MKKIYLLILAMAIIKITWAENLKPVAARIENDIRVGKAFTEINLFTHNENAMAKNPAWKEVVSEAVFMNLNRTMAGKLVDEKPENISFKIPAGPGKNMTIQLFRATIFTPDFSVVTSGNNGRPVAYSGGIHYWGIIKGDYHSLAAISIFNDEVMGIISSPQIGNLVLGKMANQDGDNHIFYNDKNMKITAPLNCFTDNDNSSYKSNDLQYANKLVNNCIRLYWEVNFDIYTGKGGVANAANYVTAIFNQSAIIYANDSIPVELAEVFVWNTTSPYTATTTSALLGQFQTYRTSINGDLGHLLGYAGSGGIAAGFNGLCASSLSSSKCYSGIQSSYNNVPTYSWSVMVVTHEQGHLMGSRHTHACVWNGNSTAIDNCGPTAGYGYEGSCSGAPTPVGGGTIMSYCHLVGGVGINLANGFGTQPKNVIKNNFNNAVCLSACFGNSCMPSANMGTTNILTTSATFNWASVTGATGYNIRYRITGSPTWQNDTSSLTSYNASGLIPGSNYEWQVQTICSGGNSIFTISTKFITIPLSCVIPGGLSTTNISYASATFNWTAVGGASGYNIQYRLVGAASWSTGTTTSTTFNVSSLAPTSNYEWQVQTICVGGSFSAFSSSVLFTTTQQPCSTPVNNFTTAITSGSATFNWGGLAGSGLGFNVRYRLIGTTIWTTVADSVSPYTAIGLLPLSNYEWQVQTICSQSNSAFSSSVNFTTLCSVPSATITANGPVTFCNGDSVWLTTNAGAGYTYQWYMNGNLISGATAIKYTAKQMGGYSVIITSGTCSAASALTNVVVNALPLVSATNVNGCSGTAIALSGTPAGGIYNLPNPYIGPSVAYTYTVTDTNGCTNTAQAAVTVYNLPVVTAQDVSGCDGTPIILSGLPAGGSFSVANPYTGSSTTYTYTYTDSNGCSNTSAVATITVNPLPAVSFSGLSSTYLVTASSATLTGVPSGGTFSGPGVSGNTFNPALAGVGGPYTITYTFSDGNNCTNSFSQQTTVNSCSVPAQPGVINEAGGTTKVCPGDTRTYKVSQVNGVSSYLWSPPAGAVIITGQGTRTVTITYQSGFVSSGILSVQAINACGNSSPRNKTITINTPVKPGIITGNANGLCGLSGVSYFVTNVAGMNYNWSFNNASAAVAGGQGTSAITANYTPNFTSATLSVTAGNGCGTSPARTLSVKAISSVPGVITGPTGVCLNQQNVPYSISPVFGAVNYTWQGPNGARFSDGITTSTTATFITASPDVTVKFASTGGNIKVRANNLCGSSSYKSLPVSIICREGLNLSNNNPGVVCSPNPAGEKMLVSFFSNVSSSYKIFVMDMVGKTVMINEGYTHEGLNEEVLDVSNLTKGIYLLELRNGDEKALTKIIIQ